MKTKLFQWAFHKRTLARLCRKRGDLELAAKLDAEALKAERLAVTPSVN